MAYVATVVLWHATLLGLVGFAVFMASNVATLGFVALFLAAASFGVVLLLLIGVVAASRAEAHGRPWR